MNVGLRLKKVDNSVSPGACKRYIKLGNSDDLCLHYDTKIYQK